MAKYIGHLLAKVHPSEWNTIAWTLAQNANAKNTPPLEEMELKNIFNSIEGIERRNNTDRWYKKGDEVRVTNMWSEVDNKIMLMKEIASMEQYSSGDRYRTKIQMIDDALGGGVEDGDLITIGGLSGYGKTTFTQQLAVNFAEQGLPVLFLSYEVKISHLWKKFCDMNIEDDLIIYSVQKNTTGNVAWIEEKIKEAKQEYEIKVICIDHLGFLIPRTSMSDISKNYSVYIGQICRDLKEIALRQNVIIIMPVHLRKTEDTPDMNSLAHSSGISQESDVVLMIHREKNLSGIGEFYQEHSKIMMVKNRKTGQSVQGHFKLTDGRFVQDDWYIPPQKVESRDYKSRKGWQPE
jgi:replicative DNA helicase